jgi:hypothetical protein
LAEATDNDRPRQRHFEREVVDAGQLDNAGERAFGPYGARPISGEFLPKKAKRFRWITFVIDA